jgi:YegS/Rv2252/BmrU family lipid kinase
MQPYGPLKFLFVINPIAGGKSKNNWQTAITDYFRTKPHAIDFLMLTGKDDAASLDDRIKNTNPDRVIAVGGDGTINFVARKLLGTGVPLGILPAGSANGLARELKLPSSPKSALEIIETGVEQVMDAVQVNDDFISLHLADLGLNAQLVKYFEESNWRGKLGYAKVLLKTLWRSQRVKMLIETDNQKILRRAFMVVIANSKTYGTGAVINPIGNVDDGKFEVVIVRRLALSELLKMIFLHRPYNPKKVELYRTSKVCISTKKKVYFQADGEYLGKINHVRAEIISSQLSVIKAQETEELAFAPA